jgi:hypothetical protein
MIIIFFVTIFFCIFVIFGLRAFGSRIFLIRCFNKSVVDIIVKVEGKHLGLQGFGQVKSGS